MKNAEYQLLKNKVYLQLLAFYDGQYIPTYCALGQEIGLNRNTVSTKIKNLEEEGILLIDNYKRVYVENPLNLDKELLKEILKENINISTIELQKKLLGVTNMADSIKQLGISYHSYHNQEKQTGNVVYGIISEGKLKYVGSTKMLEIRIEQHMKKRPWLTRDDFVVLKEIDDSSKNRTEIQLIHLLQPEWNETGVAAD